MSNRQLEEMQERRFDAWVTSQVSFSEDELEGYTIDAIEGHDGAIYGHVVTLVDGRTENIGFPPEDDDEPLENS